MMSMQDKIRFILRAGGETQTQLAQRIGVSQSTVNRWLTGSEPEGHNRDVINGLYQTLSGRADEAVRASSEVPLMGFVGAGAQVEPDYEQIPPQGLDQIAVPFPLPADMIALEVRGESMMPQFRDGAVIIVHREQRRPIESFYGEEAVVRTSDGRRFIKTIMRGPNGSVSLTSWNSAPIENVHLAWVGEIFSVFPPGALRRTSNKIAKQGGIQGRLRLVESDPTQPKRLKTANLPLLSDDNFELLVGRLMARKLRDYRMSPPSANKEVDAVAKDPATGSLVMISVKRTTRRLAEDDVQPVLNSLIESNFDTGVLVTNGSFSAGARKLADGTPLLLVDGEDLLAIADRNRGDIPADIEAQLTA